MAHLGRSRTPVMPFDSAFWAHPGAGWDRLRRESAVHRIRTPDGPAAWLVTRYAEVHEALLDPRLSVAKAHARGDDFRGFSLPAALDNHLVNRDGADHSRLRRLVAPALSPQRIEALRPDVEIACDRLLDAVQRGGTPVDLMARLAVPFPLAVLGDLLELPPAARVSLQKWASELLAPEPEQVPRARDTLGRMMAIVTDLIAARRERPGDDLVSGLIVAGGQGDRLSQDELTSMLFYLLFVFYEVSVDLISNGLLTLLLHPQQLAAIRAQPERTETAIEELLRHETPQMLAAPRFPVEDVQIAGVEIAAGQTVLLALAAANRDPQRFDRPDVLDVDRAVNPHLSFGAGIHRCLGVPLVRMQTSIVLARLLQRFPTIALAVEPEELRWREGLRHRGVRRLPVTL